MRAVLIALVLVGVACAANDAGEEVSRKSCERYRDHLIGLRYQGANAKMDVKSHRAAMKQALGEDFLDRCEKQMSSMELKCGLSARDLASARACSATASN